MMITPDILLLSDDLLFASRIRSTANALKLTIKVCRSASEILECLVNQTPRGLILDLQHPELALQEILPRVHERTTPRPRVIAYGSHVDVRSLKAARDLGCEIVMPRSVFVKELETHLPSWLS